MDTKDFSTVMDYDPVTGFLWWKMRPDASGAWNARYAGKRAMATVNPRGYLVGTFGGKGYLAHRIAWSIHYGTWPNNIIDHINGNTSDNRITNLREADHSQNQYNQGLRRNNTSGYKGVWWNRQIQKWTAAIIISGRKITLGNFDTVEAGAAAYEHAAAIHQKDFSFSRRSKILLP